MRLFIKYQSISIFRKFWLQWVRKRNHLINTNKKNLPMLCLTCLENSKSYSGGYSSIRRKPNLVRYVFLHRLQMKKHFEVLFSSRSIYELCLNYYVQNSNIEDQHDEDDIKPDENWYSSDEEPEPNNVTASPLATLLRTIQTSTSNVPEIIKQTDSISTRVDPFASTTLSTPPQENTDISVSSWFL